MGIRQPFVGDAGRKSRVALAAADGTEIVIGAADAWNQARIYRWILAADAQVLGEAGVAHVRIDASLVGVLRTSADSSGR